MTNRPNCQKPTSCEAKGKGHCRRCNGKAMMTMLNAALEFAAANAERMRRQHDDPIFRAEMVAGIRAHHGGDPAMLTPRGRAEYDEMRALGARHSVALKAAKRLEEAEDDPSR